MLATLTNRGEISTGSKEVRNLPLSICNFPFAIPPLARPLFADRVTAMPPPLRAKLMLALLAIVVLGIGLVLMIVLAGRAVKRLARHRSPRGTVKDDAWYRKPLEPEAPSSRAAEEADDE
jgi:hypothetical protein